MKASIKWKVALATLLVLAAVAAAVGLQIRSASEQDIRIIAGESIRGAGRAFAALEQADIAKLDATLTAIAADRSLAETFAARDRQRLLALAAPVFERLRKEHDVTHWYFHEPSRLCFLRVHQPAWFGDAVDRTTLLAAEKSGRGAGKELGKTAFALRVVQPWMVGGRRVGYLELGEEIDRFLGRMKAQTGDDYALVIDKRHLDAGEYAATRWGRRNDWDDLPDRVIIDRTTPDRAAAYLGDLSAIPADGLLLGELARGARTIARGAVPVFDAAGQRVGALVVLHDISALKDGMMRTQAAVMATLAICATLLAAALLLLMERLVFRRLARMVATMQDLSARLAGGDYDVVAPPPGPPDELGRFEDFFGRFLAVVGGLLKELTRRKAG